MERGAWVLGHKLCSVMVKQEQSLELPVDPLAASSAMAATAAMATTPLLGLSPLSRLPIPHQVSLGTVWAGLSGGGGSLWEEVSEGLCSPGLLEQGAT